MCPAWCTTQVWQTYQAPLFAYPCVYKQVCHIGGVVPVPPGLPSLHVCVPQLPVQCLTVECVAGGGYGNRDQGTVCTHSAQLVEQWVAYKEEGYEDVKAATVKTAERSYHYQCSVLDINAPLLHKLFVAVMKEAEADARWRRPCLAPVERSPLQRQNLSYVAHWDRGGHGAAEDVFKANTCEWVYLDMQRQYPPRATSGCSSMTSSLGRPSNTAHSWTT